MTGPEHYREAERLAKQAFAFSDDPTADLWREVAALELAAAQVHATLALAAATALANPTDINAWYQAASAVPA
jgi:hypothetical protein